MLTIDLGDRIGVSGLTYRAPAGTPDGRIGQYRAETSIDGAAWSTAATGTFADDATEKTVSFATVLARILAVPAVRPGEVARARALLASRAWSRPTEVAGTLVDCLVGHRLP